MEDVYAKKEYSEILVNDVTEKLSNILVNAADKCNLLIDKKVGLLIEIIISRNPGLIKSVRKPVENICMIRIILEG